MLIWVRLPAPPLTCCAALGKEVSFSGDFLLSKAAMRMKLGEVAFFSARFRVLATLEPGTELLLYGWPPPTLSTAP